MKITLIALLTVIMLTCVGATVTVPKPKTVRIKVDGFVLCKPFEAWGKDSSNCVQLPPNSTLIIVMGEPDVGATKPSGAHEASYGR